MIFFVPFSFQEMFVLLTTDVHSYLIMRLRVCTFEISSNSSATHGERVGAKLSSLTTNVEMARNNVNDV